MASTTPANMLVSSILGMSIPAYLVVHAWKFDRCRCLIPRRKNAIRTGMVWLLAFSMIGFTVWAILLAVQKYRIGWMLLPKPIGIVPVPVTLWTESQKNLYKVGDILLVISFCLYDAVTLEEALYWTFLLKSMKESRSPRSRHQSKSRKLTKYLNSNVFVIWVVLTVLATIAHASVPFVGGTDAVQQSIRLFLFEGDVAAINVFLSLLLVYYLPGFIRQVQAHGASEDVVSKLRFFEELNLIRTVLRALLAATLIAQGYSATTNAQALLVNPLSNDVLFMVTIMSFWLSNIISIMLYLPISLSETNETETPARQLVRRRITHGGPDLGPHARRSSMRPETLQAGGKGKYLDDFEIQDPLCRLRSHHSYEHRTLVTLLRDRGTIQENERVPEDDLFDMDGQLDDEHDRTDRNYAPRETRVGMLNADDDGRREFEDNSFITSSKSMEPQLAVKRKSDHSEKSFAAPLPSAIAQFAGPLGGFDFPAQPVTTPDVVIEVSRQVEITHDIPAEGMYGSTYPPPARK